MIICQSITNFGIVGMNRKKTVGSYVETMSYPHHITKGQLKIKSNNKEKEVTYKANHCTLHQHIVFGGW